MNDASRKIDFRATSVILNAFPEIALVAYGITYALIGEKMLYRLDISYSTYGILQISLGIVIPIFILIAGFVRTFHFAKKRQQPSGKMRIHFLVLAALFFVVCGMCYQEQHISRERFRSHDCRESLKLFAAKNVFPRCPSSLVQNQYLFFDRNSLSVPRPIAMDLPENHVTHCNILYSDGSVIRLPLQNQKSCEAVLFELNRQHPMPLEYFERFLKIAKKHDENHHSEGGGK